MAQAGRWTLWAPVAFGLGVAGYFALPAEPLAAVGWLLGVVGVCSAMAARRLAPTRSIAVVVTLAALGAVGFSAAKARTQQVRAPIISGGGDVRAIEAWVLDIDSPGRSGARLLLAPIRIAGLSPDETPIRIRVTIREAVEMPGPGQAVRLRAVLNAPPPPASPGAYDFARDAFFDGIGGVGFALGPPVEISRTPPPWRLGWAMRLNAARWALARRIVAQVGPTEGGLAAAMVTGHEAFVPQSQVDDLRAAGLSHIISISGLHMAIVGGFAFAVVRLLVAAWPWLALRLSGKKLAALLGLFAVGGYLLLSGAPAPAQRAAITAAAAFGAILVDRRAISLHALAIAALVILALQPESVTAPGFQMSFAATVALVALAEAWRPPVREINAPWAIRAVQALGVWLLASLAASLVAGLATGPFAIQHFNRVSVYGLPANLAVAPISSFVMMPALAVGAVTAPLGLGEAPLAVAGWAIGLMLRIAEWAAQAPHSTLLIPSAPAWTLSAAFLGILWPCLWKGRLRWLGLPFALAVSLAPRPPAPDLWAGADGAAFAVRRGDEAILLRPDVKRFGPEFWAQRRGLTIRGEGQAARDHAFACDRWSCVSRSGAPSLAAIWSKRPPSASRMAELCARRDLILVRGPAPATPCNVTVLDREDFSRGGAVELYWTDRGWRTVWSQDLRGRRPWTGFSGSGG